LLSAQLRACLAAWLAHTLSGSVRAGGPAYTTCPECAAVAAAVAALQQQQQQCTRADCSTPHNCWGTRACSERTRTADTPRPLIFFLHHHTQHPLLPALQHTPNASWPRQTRCCCSAVGGVFLYSCMCSWPLSHARALTTINDYYEPAAWLLLSLLVCC
jgi:hypothetical protein